MLTHIATPFKFEASGDVIKCVASIFDAGCSCGTKNWPQEQDDDEGREARGLEGLRRGRDPI